MRKSRGFDPWDTLSGEVMVYGHKLSVKEDSLGASVVVRKRAVVVAVVVVMVGSNGIENCSEGLRGF